MSDLRARLYAKLHEVGDWHIYQSRDCGEVVPIDAVTDFVEEIRAILDDDQEDDS